MRIAPDTHLRLAASEAASLELDVGDVLAEARIAPRAGEALTVPLSQNSFSFPSIPTPNVVTVEWLAPGSSEAAYTTTAEVVSRHYVTMGQIRAYGGDQDDFEFRLEEDLFWTRQAATEVFEEAARRSFVRRLGRFKDFGRGRELALPHHDVQEVLTEGYAQSSDARLGRLPGCGPFPQFVEYVYGADSVPAEVSRAVLELTAYVLRPSNRPIGATGESSDAGYVHFTTAGRDGATAIPEVNAAIEQFGAGVHHVW